MPSFFDEYPRFYDTSRTGTSRIRNNVRFEVLIRENRDLVKGARVLDFASHDGRWSLAALKVGAASVVGVEPIPELVRNARENMRHYGVGEDVCRFVEADAMTALRQEKLEADVVFGFGFLTVFADQPGFFALVQKLNPAHVVVDTHISADTAPTLLLHRYLAVETRNGVEIGSRDDVTHCGDYNLGAVPSRSALRMMLEHFGYTVRELDFGRHLGKQREEELEDYHDGRRVAFVASRAA